MQAGTAVMMDGSYFGTDVVDKAPVQKGSAADDKVTSTVLGSYAGVRAGLVSSAATSGTRLSEAPMEAEQPEVCPFYKCAKTAGRFKSSSNLKKRFNYMLSEVGGRVAIR